MTFVVEVDGRWCGWRIGRYDAPEGTSTRWWWGYFAVTVIREPWEEWVVRPKVWGER